MSVPPDSTLANLEQTIADLRRELAQLTAERDELLAEQHDAQARETATAEVLRVINSSPGDLTPVFETILEKAHALCGVAYGSLQLYDGAKFRAVAVHSLPEPLARRLREGYAPGPNHPVRRLLEGEDYIHVRDMAEIDDPIARVTVEEGRIRTLLAVALRKDSKLLGRITAARKEVRPFTDKEIALLRSFAEQAVIAMENARLLTEQREALEQQTATAEVLQVINASPGDLAPVFEAMLEKAMRLCEATFGSFWTLDGDHFHPVAHRGLPARYAEYLRRGVTAAGAGTGRARLLAGEAFAHIANLADDEPYRTGEPHRRALVDLGGARTALLVPLRRDDTVSGLIMIYRQEVRPFTDKQTALLQTFAAQAVIAMESARMLGELRHRTDDLAQSLKYQTATSELLEVISRSTSDVQPVLDTMLGSAARLCASAVGGVAIRQGNVFRYVATMSMSAEMDKMVRAHIYGIDRSSAIGRVALSGAVVHIPDAQADAEYSSPTTNAMGTRTILGVPLLREGEVIGVIVQVRYKVEPFSERQIALVRTFADQAVIAMENARLLGELRERTDQVAELNRGLETRVAEQVEELGRVGRLKRFLAPQLAEMIVSRGDEKILESHRREIVVVFCDLRGYTAFAETAEPEEVLDFLREYHGALGPLVSQFEGTLDQFSGDGIMVFFNDPVPMPDPAERAVKMAVAMREAASSLIAAWRERGRELGFGVGIAQGYATLGQIGFSERSGYTAIGTVCNVAARLCGEAKDGQILLSQRVNVALKGSVATEQVGALALKGLTQPVVTHNVPLTTSQPALRVIDGGNH